MRNSGRRWHRRIPSAVPLIRRGLYHEGLNHKDTKHQGSAFFVTFVIYLRWAMVMGRRFLAILALLVVPACATSLRNPSIADLQRHPGRYQDHTVSVSGVVTTSWGLPLVPFRFYKVDDGTGEVTVLSQSSRMPARGERVRVKGNRRARAPNAYDLPRPPPATASRRIHGPADHEPRIRRRCRTHNNRRS